MQFFAEDAQFQKSFTSFPLKFTIIEPGAALEAQERSVYVVTAGQDHLGFLLPNRQYRLANDLRLSVDYYGSDARVTLRQNDSGVRVEFVFKYGILNDGCWYLDEIIDSST